MGVDLNKVFMTLNTNNSGESANVLDADEVAKAQKQNIWTVYQGMTAEQFKEENKHKSFADYDINADSVITVDEQKASIAGTLKNVWTSMIARFFKDDITYDWSKEGEIREANERVQARINNCLEYIEFAKQKNIDIFADNTDTSVDDKGGEPKEILDSDQDKRTVGSRVMSITVNDDGTETDIISGGVTRTTTKYALTLKRHFADDNTTQTFDYNEDGSYTCHQTENNGWVYHFAHDKNDQRIGYYCVTAHGNYKANALEGEDFEATLARLGITDEADIKAVRKANPKAAKRGRFLATEGDVYIPKSVIENMSNKNQFEEDRFTGKKRS